MLANELVGPDVYLLRLAAGPIATAARPGQFVMLRVAPGPEPLLARPFSVHGVDGEDLLVLYQVRGRGTALLSQAAPGAELRMWGPLGRGFELNAKRPALVAGGLGIAPLSFVARALEDKGIPFQLLSGGATREAIEGLEKRLEALLRGRLERGPVEKLRSFVAAKTKASGSLSSSTIPFSGTCTSTTIDGSYGEKGMVTLSLQNSFSLPAAYRPDAVLACGPLAMLKAVAVMCSEKKAPCQVSLEAPMACGVGACLGCVLPAAAGGYVRVCQEGPVMDAAALDWERIEA